MGLIAGQLALPLLAQDGRTRSTTVPIPDEMRFCAQHCVTFHREQDGHLYNYTNLARQHDVKRELIIDQFTPESVIIRRTDTGSNPMTAVYSGHMDPGNTSLRGGGWRLTWGSGLKDQPASDEERDSQEAARIAAMPLEERVLRAIHLAGGKHLLIDRMHTVRSEIDRGEASCSAKHGNSRDSCMADVDALRGELSREMADFREDVDALTQAHNTFAVECANKKPEACDKQAIVDDWLTAYRQY